MKDCIRSDKEERIKDTSWVSDGSKRMHYASVTEVAESGVEESFVEVHLFI